MGIGVSLGSLIRKPLTAAAALRRLLTGEAENREPL